MKTICAENGIPMATHPSYSPHVSPLNMFSFGDINYFLDRTIVSSHRELLAAIEGTVSEIQEDFTSSFENRMEKLKYSSENTDNQYLSSQYSLI
jgi:hypothetical protein